MNHRGEIAELAADRAADGRAGQQRAARAPGVHAHASARSRAENADLIRGAAGRRDRRRQRRRCAYRRLARRGAQQAGCRHDRVRARSPGGGARRAGVQQGGESSLALTTPAGDVNGRARRARAPQRARTRSPRRRLRSRLEPRLQRSRAGLEAHSAPCVGASPRPVRARGAAIIDDTYNANPDSVRAAIDVLAAAPAPRWLVLGDMGEVGAQGPAFHREVGRLRARARASTGSTPSARSPPRPARRSVSARRTSRRSTRSLRIWPPRQSRLRRCSSRARASCGWSAWSQLSRAPAWRETH